MSEDAELRARIAALTGKEGRIIPRTTSNAATSGRINQQRQTETSTSPPTGRGSGSYPTGRGAGWSGYRASGRYAPYHQPRAYPHNPSYRNRTLVVNNATAPAAQSNSPATPISSASNQWVSKRDRHMQLINTSVYNQKTQQRQQEIEATAHEKQRVRNEKEKARVIKAFQGPPTVSTTYGQPPPTGSLPIRDVQINNLRFRVAADGSKLIRMFGEPTFSSLNQQNLISPDDSNSDPKATPKQTKVAGVTFHRSKNGNLYRAGLVKKSMRYRSKSQELWKTQSLIDPNTNRQHSVKKSTELCPRFTATGTDFSNRHLAGLCKTDVLKTPHLSSSVGRLYAPMLTDSTGICAHGNRCRYVHDPDKIAICKEFLRHGRCAAGDGACNLSHDPTPHRVPACTHFLRGNCTNQECRYAHVAVNPSAPVCRAFASIGYCQKGAECTERHVFECPDYANTGTCRNKKCRLPHVDTAGNMRKAKSAENKMDEAETSDLSSDEESYDEIDFDDVDSDEFSDDEVVMAGNEEQGRELSQQQDFVGFS